jgi:hypothetical protein
MAVPWLRRALNAVSGRLRFDGGVQATPSEHGCARPWRRTCGRKISILSHSFHSPFMTVRSLPLSTGAHDENPDPLLILFCMSTSALSQEKTLVHQHA